MTQIYLISPEKINIAEFSKQLEIALKTNLVPVFQLRLKNCDKKDLMKSAKELKKICDDNNCLFIINDDYEIAINIGAAGVHVGLEDKKISEIRKKINKNFIIGASCYDSRHLAIEAAEAGANYLSFGTFFPSKTKNSHGKPDIEILNWCNEMMDLPIVAIGGINDKNCDVFVKAKTDFIAIISYAWQHPQGVDFALKNLKKILMT